MQNTTTSRPILFSAPMVIAILNGTKTQTRRILKPQPDAVETHHFASGPRASKPYEIVRCYDPPARFKPCNSGWSVNCPGPFRFAGKPGDELWVKETHRAIWSKADDEPHLQYRADGAFREPTSPIEHNQFATILDDMQGEIMDNKDRKWRPSIFTHRWASRITLQITDVRIQRLHDISEEDSKAEGMQQSIQLPNGSWMVAGPAMGGTYREGFRYLWDKINSQKGPGEHGYSWAANPYVAAYTFTVIKP